MAHVDRNVEQGLELMFTGAKVSAKLIIAVMELALEKMKNDKDKGKHFQSFKGKQGQQKLKELFEKYQGDNIESISRDLTKEEVDFIRKELKAMGVDFSIRKVDDDMYSLFFAGKDVNAIEKGMENAVHKFTKREQDKKKNKGSKFNVKDFFKKLQQEQKLNKTDENKKERTNERTNERTM